VADERDEIRSRIDIVDLVGREIQLKKTGKTWKGLCPFHQDKNPSFTVNSETGRYKCWSCGEAGDIFEWEMKRRNVDFVEALQTLAALAGVSLEKRGGISPSVKLKQESAMAEALAYFREQLEKSSTATEYCQRRSIGPEAIKKWEIGYAPDAGDALATRLQRAGFDPQESKDLFLIDQNARGSYYDKFRGRLMFAIRDEKGQLVAFGGRILGDGHPKYINSSDTPLYKKSRVLYGMNVAKETISKLRQAVLVEGYLDVIACHEAGATQALASLGTALSEDHAKLLKRWCDEVVILYDSDDAGKKAAERAIAILKSESLAVRVALMPAGEDPDTLLKTRGPAAVKEAIDQALPPIAYHLGILKRNSDTTKVEYWNLAVAIIAQAETPVEVSRYLEQIAPAYPWERNPNRAIDVLREQVRELRGGRRDQRLRASAVSEHHALRSELTSAEIIVFRAILGDHRAALWPVVCTNDLFTSNLGQRLSSTLSTVFGSEPPEGVPALWLHKIEQDELERVLSDLTADFRAENLVEERVIDAVRELERLKQEREREQVRRSGASYEERGRLLLKHRGVRAEEKPGSDSLF
jgi:DNA primase